MPIPQETISEPSTPTSDIPKIKEKALPTTDNAPSVDVELETAEVKKSKIEGKEATSSAEKKDGTVEGNGQTTAAVLKEDKEATKSVEKDDGKGEGNGQTDSAKDVQTVVTALKEDIEATKCVEKDDGKAEENEQAASAKDIETVATVLKEDIEATKSVEKSEDKVEGNDQAAGAELEAEDKVEHEQVEVVSMESKSASEDPAQSPSTPEKSDATRVMENPDLTPRKAEAFNLLAQGKRHYFVRDYESAVETLGEVCEKFSAIYGETGTEMGDVYFYYGVSLLELAREEANLLNVDKEDKKDCEDEEEDEEMEEEEQDDGKPGGGIGEKKIGDEEDGAEEKKEEGAADSAVDEKDSEATMDEEDDVNNLQLAWEMLELSRAIYFKVDNQLKLADIYLKLSEVSMESENYAAAIEDIEKGLAIYVRELTEDHRNIAEAHYKLGMAHANNDNYPEAVKQFQRSKETLLARVDNLQTTNKPDSELSKEPFYKKESEIKELEMLLPEINARIEECNSDNKEIKKAISNFIGSGKRPVANDGAGPSSAVDEASSGASSPAGSKPASDISHLVKKKRKPEDVTEKTEVEGKRIKLDESPANGNPESTTASTAEDVDMKATAAEFTSDVTGKSTGE